MTLPFLKSELLEETGVVFINQTHIVNAVIFHGNSLNAHTESKAAVFVGIYTAVGENVGVYHTCAEDLYPALVLAYTTALSATYEAGYVYLCGGLGKGEVVGTEAELCVVTEKCLCKGLEHSLEITHGDALVNYQALYLMEQGRVSSINCV